jgi:hypothetical protein
MWNEETQESALFKSALAAQFCLNFNDNCHQVSAEAKAKEMKESTSMTNHDPRMNRTNPKYRALLGIVGT